MFGQQVAWKETLSKSGEEFSTWPLRSLFTEDADFEFQSLKFKGNLERISK